MFSGVIRLKRLFTRPLVAILIHLLWNLCVLGAGNSVIRFCFAVSTRNQAISFLWRSWSHQCPEFFHGDCLCCKPCSSAGIPFGRFFPRIRNLRNALSSFVTPKAPSTWMDRFIRRRIPLGVVIFSKEIYRSSGKGFEFFLCRWLPTKSAKKGFKYVHQWATTRLFINDYLLNCRNTVFSMCINEQQRRYLSMITY